MSNWIIDSIKALTKDDFREIMASFGMVAGFVYMFAITFIVLPSEANMRNADIILGMVGTMVFGRVFAYYFDKPEKPEKTHKSNNSVNES